MTTHLHEATREFAPDPARVLTLLAQCPVYQPTPLLDGDIIIKDETDRMGLGAFKALGGVYAVARLIGEEWEKAYGTSLGRGWHSDPAVREFAGTLTFVCASAGNHGMAVAAGARLFGARARIHLAETVAQSFADRLAAKGAQVIRSGALYEDSMQASREDAEGPGRLLLADASWPGYVRPPSLVMEGYTVVAEEMRQAFTQQGGWPTHVFLQAGVGGLAAAVAHMIRRTWPVQPRILVVEPEAAPCLQRSHEAGRPVRVEGPVSNMGRLDCKEPSHIAFEVLEAAGVDYLTVSDRAAMAARDDIERSRNISTTPSGAAGFAAARRHMAGSADGREMRPLVIVTERAV